MFSLLLCLAGNITPIITSSSNDKIKAIQEKISDKVRGLNYKTDDQAAKIKEITNGRGVDFVVNNTGVAPVAGLFLLLASLLAGRLTGSHLISSP